MNVKKITYGKIEFLKYWSKRFFLKQYIHSGNLRDYQIAKINDMLSNARANSGFYADIYGKNHISPDFKLKTLDEIRLLPIVKKETFKAACLNNLVLCGNFDKKNLHYAKTTGSTGVPTEIFFSQDSMLKKKRVKQRVYHDAGIRRYNPYCMLWRSKKHTNKELERIQNGLYLFLSVGDVASPVSSALTKEKIAFSVKSILEFKPKVIHGYVSALFSVAEYMRRNNLRIAGLKRIIAAAEYLSPTVWHTLEESFQCPVINFYGASEASAIACSSKDSRNMIISEDLYFVEVLDENDEPVKPGNQGLITLTNLTATAMPFIRFQIGDMAVVDDSFYDYGENFRYFVSVEGRTNDIFELADGSIIFSHLWHIIFRDQLWIERFQVIQKSHSDIEIKILPFEKNEREFSLFERTVRQRFAGVNFDFRIVDRIGFGAGNKFRAVMSEVPNKFNRINK